LIGLSKTLSLSGFIAIFINPPKLKLLKLYLTHLVKI